MKKFLMLGTLLLATTLCAYHGDEYQQTTTKAENLRRMAKHPEIYIERTVDVDDTIEESVKIYSLKYRADTSVDGSSKGKIGGLFMFGFGGISDSTEGSFSSHHNEYYTTYVEVVGRGLKLIHIPVENTYLKEADGEPRLETHYSVTKQDYVRSDGKRKPSTIISKKFLYRLLIVPKNAIKIGYSTN